MTFNFNGKNGLELIIVFLTDRFTVEEIRVEP